MRHASVLLLLLATSLPAQPSSLEMARAAVAADQYADARALLETAVLDAPAPQAQRLLELIGTRSNLPPVAAATAPGADEIRAMPLAELVHRAAATNGVRGLVRVFHDGARFRASGFADLAERARSAASPAESLRLSEPLLAFLRERPWIQFDDRARLLDHHIQQLVLNRQVDAAIDALLLRCLDRASILRLDLPGADIPPAWRFAPDTLVHPIEKLIDVATTHERLDALAERLRPCARPEAQYLRQLLLLAGGDTSEIADFAAAWTDSRLVPYAELGGGTEPHRLALLPASHADRLGTNAPAAALYKLAIEFAPDRLPEDQARHLLGALARTTHQAGQDPSSALAATVLCPGRPVEWQRHARRLVRTLGVETQFVAALRDQCPDHPWLRVAELQTAVTNADAAAHLLPALWRDHPLALLTEVPDLPRAYPDTETFLADLLASNRLAALDDAGSTQLRDFADRLGDWAKQTDPPAALLPVAAAALRTLGPDRADRHLAVTRDLHRLGRRLLRQSEDTAPLREHFPAFHFDAAVQENLGLTPLPGTRSDIEREFEIPSLAEPTLLERYLAGLSTNELTQLADALPPEGGLRPHVLLLAGAEPPAAGPLIPKFGWLTAKHLLARQDLDQLLRFLEGHPELRDLPGLLHIADTLIDQKHTAAARFVLGLGDDAQGSPDERAHRIVHTAKRLAEIGLHPDAIRQARVLLGSPLESHRREARALVLKFETAWIKSLPPAELKQIIDGKLARLNQHPDDIELLEELHRFYSYQQQFRAAFRMLQRRAQAEPNNPSPVIRGAVFRARYLHEPEEAWLDFLHAHELEPASWRDANQIGLIQELALNAGVFLDRLNQIDLPLETQNRRTAAAWFRAIERAMKPLPAAYPDKLLVTVDKLLAFREPVVAPIRPRLEEYRAMLLVQLDRVPEARRALDLLFAREDPPAWDIRYTAEGPVGLAPTHRRLTGKLPAIEHPVWKPVLEAWDHQLRGDNATAYRLHLANLDNWPEAIADQVPNLLDTIERLAASEAGCDRDLLDRVALRQMSHPDVLKHICLRLVQRGHGRDVLARLNTIRHAKQLTDKGRAHLLLLRREIEFRVEQRDWRDKEK